MDVKIGECELQIVDIRFVPFLFFILFLGWVICELYGLPIVDVSGAIQTGGSSSSRETFSGIIRPRSHGLPDDGIELWESNFCIVKSNIKLHDGATDERPGESEDIAKFALSKLNLTVTPVESKEGPNDVHIKVTGQAKKRKKDFEDLDDVWGAAIFSAPGPKGKEEEGGSGAQGSADPLLPGEVTPSPRKGKATKPLKNPMTSPPSWKPPGNASAAPAAAGKKAREITVSERVTLEIKQLIRAAMDEDTCLQITEKAAKTAAEKLQGRLTEGLTKVYTADYDPTATSNLPASVQLLEEMRETKKIMDKLLPVIKFANAKQPPSYDAGTNLLRAINDYEQVELVEAARCDNPRAHTPAAKAVFQAPSAETQPYQPPGALYPALPRRLYFFNSTHRIFES